MVMIEAALGILLCAAGALSQSTADSDANLWTGPDDGGSAGTVMLDIFTRLLPCLLLWAFVRSLRSKVLLTGRGIAGLCEIQELDAVLDAVNKEHTKLIRAKAALDEVGIAAPTELRDKIRIKSEELTNAQVGNRVHIASCHPAVAPPPGVHREGREKAPSHHRHRKTLTVV